MYFCFYCVLGFKATVNFTWRLWHKKLWIFLISCYKIMVYAEVYINKYFTTNHSQIHRKQHVHCVLASNKRVTNHCSSCSRLQLFVAGLREQCMRHPKRAVSLQAARHRPRLRYLRGETSSSLLYSWYF